MLFSDIVIYLLVLAVQQLIYIKIFLVFHRFKYNNAELLQRLCFKKSYASIYC